MLSGFHLESRIDLLFEVHILKLLTSFDCWAKSGYTSNIIPKILFGVVLQESTHHDLQLMFVDDMISNVRMIYDIRYLF